MSSYDDIYDALKDAVKALGGAASVGKRLRPEAPIGKAERWLLDCINPNRDQKLDTEQFMAIVGWSRAAGHHMLMDYITDDAGYKRTTPIMLVEQLALLQNQAIEAQRHAESKANDLRVLLENPRLVAMMNAAHVNTEGMSA